MTENNISVEPLITLELDTGERSFTNIDELRDWSQGERQAFSWLEDVSRKDANAGQPKSVINQWLGQVNGFIQQYESNTNEKQKADYVTKLVNQTQQAFHDKNLITSKSADAQFVFDLRDNHSAVVAGYALSNLMRQKVLSS